MLGGFYIFFEVACLVMVPGVISLISLPIQGRLQKVHIGNFCGLNSIKNCKFFCTYLIYNALHFVTTIYTTKYQMDMRASLTSGEIRQEQPLTKSKYSCLRGSLSQKFRTYFDLFSRVDSEMESNVKYVVEIRNNEFLSKCKRTSLLRSLHSNFDLECNLMGIEIGYCFRQSRSG